MFKYIAGLLTISFFYLLISDGMSHKTETMRKKSVMTSQKSARISRLKCHTKSITFEHVYKKERVKGMQDAVKSANIQLKSKFKLSEHMLTQLAKHISLSSVDEMIQKQIDSHIDTTKSTDDTLIIDYFIYENDKEDPGKKTAKSKLYAGYLVFNFLLKDEQVYRLQIDFMDTQGKDIEEKIECMLESVLTLHIVP